MAFWYAEKSIAGTVPISCSLANKERNRKFKLSVDVISDAPFLAYLTVAVPSRRTQARSSCSSALSPDRAVFADAIHRPFAQPESRASTPAKIRGGFFALNL